MNRKRPILVVAITLVVIAVVLSAGLRSGKHPDSARPRTPPGHRSQPVTPPAGRTLPCDEAIGTQPPPRAMRVVLGVVALPTSPGLRRALQTSRTGAPGSRSRLFAKGALWVRSGARFELIVPVALRGQLSIGWGNAGEGHVGSIARDAGCRAPDHRWINFAGGYWTAEPRCATLIVATPDGRRRRVRVGIGQACSGQLPPPQPTQS